MTKPTAPPRAGRKRRAAGWTFVVLGVLLAGVWGRSRNTQFAYSNTHWSLWIGQGVIAVYLADELDDHGITGWKIEAIAQRAGWRWNATDRAADPLAVSRLDAWFFSYTRSTALKGGPEEVIAHQALRVSLWPIPLLLWFPGVMLVRSGTIARRRAMTNACPKCGYSLIGLAADAPCPECGKNVVTA